MRNLERCRPDVISMAVLCPIKGEKNVLYVIEILDGKSGDLFGVYDDLNKGIVAAKRYNQYRGMYPTIIVHEFELNMGMPFVHNSYDIDLNDLY